ncbi:MAG TPA: hypothetical protein VI915_04025 [Thermoplasmata archaeon]|nr:hypothetical protein [Thermoplasmata archaeon]HLE46136.1 hypothetical protein [Thermoplasmata archaeon]
MKAWQWIVTVVLVAAGLYFLVFHMDPLPANHEAIGLGTFHLAHDVIGIVLFATAVLIVWRARRVAPTTQPA